MLSDFRQKLLKATNSVEFEVAIQGHAVSTFVAHLIHHSVGESNDERLMIELR